MTDEPLDAVTRGIAESNASIAKVMKIRQDEHSKIGVRHNQVAETTTRLELFKETVHDKVKVMRSEPRWPLTARSQDPRREGHANRSAASDVARKQATRG